MRAPSFHRHRPDLAGSWSRHSAPQRAAIQKRLSAVVWLAAALLILVSAGGVRGQSNGVFRQVYTALTSSSLLGLTNNSSFPDFPATSEILSNAFEGPYNFSEQFGDRFRAVFVAPLTGTYVFWVQGDDTGLLYLSSDDSPANKGIIAINTLTAL